MTPLAFYNHYIFAHYKPIIIVQNYTQQLYTTIFSQQNDFKGLVWKSSILTLECKRQTLHTLPQNEYYFLICIAAVLVIKIVYRCWSSSCLTPAKQRKLYLLLHLPYWDSEWTVEFLDGWKPLTCVSTGACSQVSDRMVNLSITKAYKKPYHKLVGVVWRRYCLSWRLHTSSRSSHYLGKCSLWWEAFLRSRSSNHSPYIHVRRYQYGKLKCPRCGWPHTTCSRFVRQLPTGLKSARGFSKYVVALSGHQIYTFHSTYSNSIGQKDPAIY